MSKALGLRLCVVESAGSQSGRGGAAGGGGGGGGPPSGPGLTGRGARAGGSPAMVKVGPRLQAASRGPSLPLPPAPLGPPPRRPPRPAPRGVREEARGAEV